ncbi:MAG: ABC transporter ATP-binding protein [Eubacteriales bacterium]|nr:ABC transporter ATP-binding protein [Eubacteriales bacterium]
MIDMTDVVKRYTLGGETIYALNHISLHVDEGEYVAIIGPSGSGKSTLMNIIGCLDVADGGSYLLNGKPIQKYRERQLAHIRNQQIGFIFQGFNLLSKLSALENVELPMIYQGVRAGERRRLAKEALERVGLGARMKHRPAQLSGGQQQRCAIARAIAVKPSLILADEPTGNLDKKTGREILQIFRELHEAGNTIVLITHDNKVAQCAGRVIRIEDGHLYENQEAPQDDLPIV